MSDEVRAFGDRRTNADLIFDLNQLGLLRGRVLDASYGLGRFWARYRPEGLVTLDIDAARRVDLVGDFTRLPFADRAFGTVVLDAPYKLNGTASRGGPATSDEDYGVGGEYRTIEQRHQLMFDGMTDCARVAAEILIVKCQDQVCSGDVQWQTDLMRDHALSIGWVKLDVLHVAGYRRQPPGRRQLHARRDYSTAIVFERAKMSPRHAKMQSWVQEPQPDPNGSPTHRRRVRSVKPVPRRRARPQRS